MDVKKVFVSTGFSHRTYTEVLCDFMRAEEIAIDNFGRGWFELINNYSCEPPYGSSRTYCLGEAIKKLGECDACIFMKDWTDHKGCMVEFEVCKQHGIKMIFE